MNEFYLLIVSFGLTEILMFGTIFNKPRNFIKRCDFFKELLECSLCCGTHAGLFIGLCNYSLTQYKEIGFLALASAGFCFFFDHLLDLILKKHQ